MRASRCDRGDSLVEILVALAVLSIGITALLGALATNITTTGVNRSQSQASATLLAASEYVKSLGPLSCGGGTTNVSDAQVPHDDVLFTVAYGPAQPINGNTPCSAIYKVPVRVTGDGFDLAVDVVKRP